MRFNTWDLKNKRKVTPQIAMRILEKYADNITAEDTEIILEFMYNFAKLALNQQLQRRSEGRRSADSHPGPG